MTMQRSGPRHGLTLVELLVAVGIIALLASITMSIGARMTEAGRDRQTRRVFDLLHTAVTEWNRLADRKLTWWQVGDDPDWRTRTDVHADTEEVFIISEITDVIGRPTEIRDFIAQIDQRFIHRYRAGDYPPWINTPREELQQDTDFDGSLTMLDAWGTPIYAIHPGRTWTELDGRRWLQRDTDGSIRTYNEERYGIAPNRQVVFVAAGPDRLFGLDREFGNLFGNDREAAKAKARQDNLYSTPVTEE